MADLQPVTLMTYNVQGLSDFLLPVGNLSTRIDHIANFLVKIVCKYMVDVLILQELFSTRLYKRVKKRLEPLMGHDTRIINDVDSNGWLPLFWKHLLPCFSFIPGGVIIFSRHSIVGTTMLIFSDGVYADRFGSKAAVLARILINNRPLDVVGMHLQSYHGMTAHKIRESQVSELVKWLWTKRRDWSTNTRQFRGDTRISSSSSPPPPPLLVAGDFNSCLINDKEQSEELFNVLKGVAEPTFGSELPEASYSDLTNDFCGFQNRHEGYDHVYDYIFASPGTTVLKPQTVVNDVMDSCILVHRWFLWCIRTEQHIISNASDHFPVYATIGI